MTNLYFKDINSATRHFIAMFQELGNNVKSINQKNQTTYKKEIVEIRNIFYTIKNPKACIVSFENNVPNRLWTMCELLTEFLNLNPPIMIKYFPKTLINSYDMLEDGTVSYTYGSRLQEYHQLLNVYNKLKNNLTSKRCIVQIFMPYDTQPNALDVPCTVNYHFVCRNNKLDLTVFYRSHDFFKGFKIDMVVSSFVLQVMAGWLGVEVGELHILDSSLHYYKTDKNKLETLSEDIRHNYKDSTPFVVPRVGMKDFYIQLRKVKHVEELSNRTSDIYMRQLIEEIKFPFYQDFARVFANRKNTQFHFATKTFQEWK